MPAGGNANSSAPTLTPDGRFVLFSSLANNLVASEDGQFVWNLFLRDRASNTTVLVTANVKGKPPNGGSSESQVSTNGRFVVFQSEATDLLAEDTNRLSDVFLRDLQSGSTILVSVAAEGGWGNGSSTAPVMSPDARYVAFISEASNLVAGDTNGIPDVFVRDLLNQTTVLASVGSFKAPPRVTWGDRADFITLPAPALTPDGRRVAFVSAFSGLVPGVLSSQPQAEVYVRDLGTGTTHWASSNVAAIAHFPSNSSSIFLSYHPSISGDGRFVTFKAAPYYGPAVARGPAAVLQFDVSSTTLQLIATNALPQLFSDDTYGPEVTPDGRFIAFSAGMAPTNQAPWANVYLFDTQTESNILVSVAKGGASPTNSLSDTPNLSPDGRYVAFLSNNTNLVSNTVSPGFHIYIRDMSAGTTEIIDVDSDGIASADQYGNRPSLGLDGHLIAFASPDANLVGQDNNQAHDVFVREMSAGTNELVSVRAPGLVPRSGSGFSSLAQIAMSPDGRWLVVSSFAEDLVGNDSNRDPDVFLSDLASGTVSLVSVGKEGASAAGGYSITPVVSSNGQFVAFASAATNLVSDASSSFCDIYRRDMAAGTNVRVSVSKDGVTRGNGISSLPAMSMDGRFIVFLSTSTNLVLRATGDGPNTFWRDLEAGVTVALTTNSAALFPPSISADGRYTAFSFASLSGNSVVVWDALAGSNVFSVASAAAAAISPSGRHLLYQGGSAVRVVDVAAKTNVLSAFSLGPIRGPVQWSADDRFVTFVARSNVSVGVFTNNQVYLGDLRAGTVALLSAGPDRASGGNERSDSPAISGDGRYVVYRSAATDLVPGTIAGWHLVLYDRNTGSNTMLNATAVADWTSRVSKPAIDATGRILAFQSCQTGLVLDDFNRLPDVFALEPEVSADTDADGLPDWWMLQYFGHVTAGPDDRSRPDDDADEDGISNVREFLTGTSPVDPASLLRLIASPASAHSIMLTWPAVPGKSYQLQYTDAVNPSGWLTFGNFVAASQEGSVSVFANQAAGYYRILAFE